MKKFNLLTGLISVTTAVVCVFSAISVTGGASDSIVHSESRDVQSEGVGNPFEFGERNTPADGSAAEIRAINHKMTVQEVKYALYKEIDEHWDLIKVRLGQPEREKVYALFLGVGTRESTLGGNGDGADIETAFSEGFGVSSAHAYGTLQTAVTAFKDCNPTFMPEDDVPEMFQYSLSESTFYDAIISDHMGIRKILHFVNLGINEEGLSGYQVVRGALKGFNTGWATYTGEHDGYYKGYPDEIISLARWYYEEGHLYDNVFTWTNDERVSEYRQGNVWDWWGDGEPSMAEITEIPETTETFVTTEKIETTEITVTTETSVTSETNLTTENTVTAQNSETTGKTETIKTETTEISVTESTAEITDAPAVIDGDVNDDGVFDIADMVLMQKYMVNSDTLKNSENGDLNKDNIIDIFDVITMRKRLLG